MKKFTIIDLMTILQIDTSLKEDLVNNFDGYDDELKSEVQKILWDGVHELKNRLAKLKYEQLLVEVDEGKRELTTDMYQQAVRKVWQDFEKMLEGKKDQDDFGNQHAYLQMREKRDIQDVKEEKAIEELTEKLKAMTAKKSS